MSWLYLKQAGKSQPQPQPHISQSFASRNEEVTEPLVLSLLISSTAEIAVSVLANTVTRSGYWQFLRPLLPPRDGAEGAGEDGEVELAGPGGALLAQVGRVRDPPRARGEDTPSSRGLSPHRYNDAFHRPVRAFTFSQIFSIILTPDCFSNPLAGAHYITMLEWITIYSSVRIHFHVSLSR